MKAYYIILIGLLFSCTKSELVISSDSLNKEGIVYKYKGERFNGAVIDTTETGRVLLNFSCVNGKIEGAYREYYENGNIAEKTEYKSGVKYGESKVFWENGGIKEIVEYHNGYRSGNYKSYFGNGRKEFVGQYYQGKRSGLWKRYHYNGNLKSKGLYKDGLQNGLWEYLYENGKIEMKGNYVNGDGSNRGSTGVPKNGREGTWKYYQEEPHFKDVEAEFNHGKPTYYRGYYSNGKIKEEGTADENGYNGKVTYYSEKGEKIRTEFF